MAHPITQLELEMSRELDNRTETDTLRRAQFRMHTLIAAWYAKLAITTELIIRSLGRSLSNVSMLKWCVRAR